MRSVSKQILAIGLPTVTVAASGMAIAYWTGGGGSGSGNATTATAGSTTLAVSQASAPATLAPGVAAGAITVTVSNPGSASVYAAQVVVTIDSVTKASGAPAGTCDSTDYALTGNTTMTVGAANLAPSASTTFSGASLGFNDKATNQDACKGATVTLGYVAS